MRKMNRLGEGAMLAIFFALMFFLIGIPIINLIKPAVSDAYGPSQMNCADASSLTSGVKITCLVIDSVVPYFIWLVISIAGGAVMSRFVV